MSKQEYFEVHNPCLCVVWVQIWDKCFACGSKDLPSFRRQLCQHFHQFMELSKLGRSDESLKDALRAWWPYVINWWVTGCNRRRFHSNLWHVSRKLVMKLSVYVCTVWGKCTSWQMNTSSMDTYTVAQTPELFWGLLHRHQQEQLLVCVLNCDEKWLFYSNP